MLIRVTQRRDIRSPVPHFDVEKFAGLRSDMVVINGIEFKLTNNEEQWELVRDSALIKKLFDAGLVQLYQRVFIFMNGSLFIRLDSRHDVVSIGEYRDDPMTVYDKPVPMQQAFTSLRESLKR